MPWISLPSLAALGIIGLAGLSGFAGCASDQVGPGSGGNGGRVGSSSGAGGSGNATTPTTGAGGGGTGGSGGTTGAGGTVTTTGAGGAGMSCTLPTVGQTCAGTIPGNPLLINFARYLLPTGSWGNSTMGDLTGGTSPFQGTGVTPLTRVVEGADPDARLRVTGTIPVASYAGFVLWFGPCANASTFMDATGTPTTTGIAAVLGGNLGGSQLKFQVQTQADYPVDAPNLKGACLFTNCDARWSQCVGPTALVTTIPASPALTSFPWSRFTGGLPVAATNGNGVVGLQFQWECVTPPSCSVDVSIGTIILTTN